MFKFKFSKNFNLVSFMYFFFVFFAVFSINTTTYHKILSILFSSF